MKSKIAFDLDGTLIDLKAQFMRFIQRWTGVDISDYTSFSIWEEYNIEKDVFWDAVHFSYREWRKTPIFEGASELLTTLYEISKEPIYIVTARNKKYATETFRLIERFCKHPFKVAMVENSDDKYKYLRDITFYVEDRRRTALQLSGIGKTVYIPRRSYNTIDNPPSGLIFIDNLRQLIPMVDLFIEEEE